MIISPYLHSGIFVLSILAFPDLPQFHHLKIVDTATYKDLSKGGSGKRVESWTMI